MITKLKTTIWAIALLFSVGSVLVLSSCGSDDEPDPTPPIEVIAPGDFTYPATTVAVGAEGSVDPSAVEGSTPAFAITSVTDADDVASAVASFSVDAATGKISIAAESTTGLYKVTVTATNSKGTGTGTAEITIGVNPDFDPTGKGYLWQYWINQDDPWTLSGLDGEIAELPIAEIEIPTGWPPDWPAGNADWNEEYLFPYLALGGVQDLIFQVPSDLACGALDPEEGGDTLYFVVETDLSLTTICTLNDAAGSSVLIGTSTISYSDDKFHWAVSLNSQIPITYIITDITSTDQFVDPLEPGEGGAPPRIYPALTGTVEQFTTPTNVFDETGILTSLTQKKVDIVLEVIAL